MSKYYPQSSVTMTVVFEDFGTKDAKLEEQYTFSFIPKDIEIEINDYNEADTFKLTIDYKNFPFDPRVLRSVGITAYMEDVEAIFNKNGSQKKIIPSEDNLVFVGFADEETISFDSENRTVSMNGRDFTALLIDQKFLGPIVDYTKTITETIRIFLDAIKSTKGITVVDRTGLDKLPLPSSLRLDNTKLGSKKGTKKQSTYWDEIYLYLKRMGLIGYIEKSNFVIDLPKNSFIGTQGFTQFVYGLNLSRLEFTRKLGRLKDLNIKVVGLDIEGKSLIEARIPKDATDPDLIGLGERMVPVINADGTKGTPKVADYLTFSVSNIRDKDHLIKKGEQIYFEYSRQQLEGRLSTKEMVLPERVFENGKPTERIQRINFSKIVNGTPIEVFISQDDLKDIEQISSRSQREKFLIDRFYSRDVARAFAASMNKISTPFYTRAVSFKIDSDSGFSMDIQFINIIDLSNANMEL